MDEERRGEREGGEVASLFYGVQNVPIRAPTLPLPLLPLFLLCVSDFHEKTLNKISRWRNTSVRPCQRLAHSPSCRVVDVAFSHGPGMLAGPSGQGCTQVGSSWNPWGCCLQLSFGEQGKDLAARHCVCGSVNSETEDGSDEKNKTPQTASRQLQ